MKVIRSFLASVVLLLPFAPTAQSAELVIGEWTPVFKGIELSISTNLPVVGAPIARRQVAYALRIDLTDPDVEFFTTPRIESNYVAGSREVAGYTPTDFLVRNGLQAVINAGYFSPGTYYSPPGTPMNAHGLLVSQGDVVSSTDSPTYAATLTFNETNGPTFIRSNLPPASNDGVYTAIAGNAAILVGGTNVGTQILDLDPRTVAGISGDRRYLYFVAIDGRQPGYSDGANMFEAAQWLQAVGAHDGINLDGGGSTTLVFETSTGQPLRINRSSAVADSGNERTVGGHFGIYAKPVPGFINDVVAEPGINSAKISFTTIQPAISEVHYGTTEELGTSGGTTAAEQSEHSFTITGLTPETGYYYQITALSNDVPQVSPLFFFTTTNLTSTNLVFDFTNSWKYFYTSLDVVNWKDTGFNAASWASGPGLLWVDTRATPTPEVEPRNTEMPQNIAAGFPFITYYFRTHFEIEDLSRLSALLFQGKIDDGAAFYLNGTEIYRLRLPVGATYTTIANGFPCAGDANCIDEFKIPMASLPSLKEGDNVLAVEVHNYNARSNDITFGLAVHQINSLQVVTPALLSIARVEGGIEIKWDGAGGMLQSAPAPDGPWEDLQAYSGSQAVIPLGEENRFYRLQR
jgi:hypothetical protein